jgi:hypothetical protein
LKENLRLGRLLGRHEALSAVAARCSAAGAEQLKEIRDEKLYLECYSDFDEFCAKELHMSRANVNRIIHLLEQFGPNYFEIAQFTRISPATYRAIAPAIQDGSLQVNGEAIALIPENADKVAAAVAEMRKAAKVVEPEQAPAPEAVAPPDPFLALRENFDRLVADFTALVRQTRDRDRLAAALGACRLKLQMMEREL